MLHSVNLLSQAPLAHGSCALPSVLLQYTIESDGKWLTHYNYGLVCFIYLEDDCPTITIENGKIREKMKKVGSVVRFACNDGFSLVGSPQRTCLSNGSWNGTASKCTGN